MTGKLTGKSRSGRAIIVFVLLIALTCTGISRQLAETLRARGATAQRGVQRTTFASMDSFALALLLGGLRGPLVMFLWSSSESQKSDRNLEDFDTKVEWIRLLQPEFDSVHIFQVWNKAYNISVQLTSLSNKYAVIIDAIDYARRMDDERPDNINILMTLANTFADKLGNSAEKSYYISRVRKESLPHTTRAKVNGGKTGQLAAMLDENGNLLPELYTPQPGKGRPDNLPSRANVPAEKTEAVRAALLAAGIKQSAFEVRRADPGSPTSFSVPPEGLAVIQKLAIPATTYPQVEWNDGSDGQYLKQFEPYPYGISPKAIGWNYFKRAQVMQSTLNQRHAQLSDLVVDSRPGLWLRFWGEEEWEFGRRAEIKAFGEKAAVERIEIEMTAANIPPTQQPVDLAAAREAIFEYGRCAQLMVPAEAEYRRHIDNFRTNADLYESHIATIRANRALADADAKYLQAILASPGERPALLAAAKASYEQATYLWQLIVVRFYVAADARDIVFAGLAPTRTFEDVPPQKIAQMSDTVYALLQSKGIGGGEVDDLNEFSQYIARSRTRLALIAAAK